MRRWTLLPTAVLVIASCTSNSATTTTIDLLPPPPSPEGSTTTVSPVTVPREGPFAPPIQGYFPDGTDFIIKIRSSTNTEEVSQIRAEILYESEGAVWDVGDVRFAPGTVGDTPSYVDGVLRLQPSNPWHVEIEFGDQFFDRLGADADQIVTTGITTGLSREGFPVLQLAPPFRWSTQFDPTGPMQIRYETFAVTMGCDEDAIACVPNGTMQAKDLTRGGATPELTIESFYPRPVSNPFYLDPGPLFSRISPRTDVDVLWTGEEMITWSGQTGASFDPKTNEWRMLSRNPDDPGGTTSRAVWVGDEMIVFSTEGTFSYDPNSDTWSSIGVDIAPPNLPFAVTSTHIYFISNGAPFVFNLDSYQFDHILAPPTGLGAQSWETYPFVLEDTLMLARIEGDRCSSRTFWRLKGIEWAQLPETSLATEEDNDCSTANQVAAVGDQLLIWDDAESLTKIYREGDWIEVGRIPGGGGESPSSALVAGSQVLVPDWRNVAILDMASLTWEEETYPGSITTGAEWVWTGSEVLAWVDGRDAWRWTPPE